MWSLETECGKVFVLAFPDGADLSACGDTPLADLLSRYALGVWRRTEHSLQKCFCNRTVTVPCMVIVAGAAREICTEVNIHQ